MPVRFGILGVSWWTKVVWPGFAAAEEAEVTWVASRTEANAREFAAEHGAPRWTGDYDAVLEAPDVDAVFVGVPNHLHHAIAMRALDRGKHVLQEKPMALTAEEAAAQARRARELGLVLGVDQETRLAEGVRDLPGLIAERVGPLRKVLVGLTLSGGAWGGWRGDPALSGGTPLEMVIHQLDLARWLFGRDPVRVFAHGGDVAGQDLTVLIDFGEGDSAIIDVCWRCIGFRQRIECYGERGYVVQDIGMPDGPGWQTVATAGGAERREVAFAVQGPATFERLVRGFCGAVARGEPLPVAAEDGVWAVRIGVAARNSLRRGEWARP